MPHVASGQSCSEDSTCSMGRLAPLTTRTLMAAPRWPGGRRPVLQADHGGQGVREVGLSTIPASRFLNSGLSRILVKTAMVMSRSLYSSMSRLMNLAFCPPAAKEAARANSG